LDFAYLPRSRMLAANRFVDFFVASTGGAVAAIVLALGKERKGFDLHAAWVRSVSRLPCPRGLG